MGNPGCALNQLLACGTIVSPKCCGGSLNHSVDQRLFNQKIIAHRERKETPILLKRMNKYLWRSGGVYNMCCFIAPTKGEGKSNEYSM